MKTCLAIVLLCAQPLLAATAWYASPAATAGAGSLADPWHLQVAGTNALIVPGDTLYLRGTNNGGSYRGCFIYTRNITTITNYPGEFPAIDGGSIGILLTNIPNTPGISPSQTVISGSEYWQVGQVIYIDTEQFQLSARGATITNWTLNRGWNDTATNSHTVNTPVILGADGMTALAIQGNSNSVFGLETYSSMSTNRYVGSNWFVVGGINLAPTFKKNNAINCVIHDVGHPGIGYWTQGRSRVYGCFIFNIGMYDFTFSDAPRGSAVYSQNDGVDGFAEITHCINFRDFTSGGKVFGETGPVKDFGFFSNIVFQCSPTIEGVSGSSSTSNLWYNGNMTMGTPAISYVSVSNVATYFINNHVVHGGLELKEHADSTLTNNDIFLPKNITAVLEYPTFYTSTLYPSNVLNLDWNRNRYYRGTSVYAFADFQFDYTTLGVASVNSAGGGSLRFDNDSGKAWTNWSRLDIDSTYTTPTPTNIQTVRAFQNEYNPLRIHVAVVNTDTNTTNATLSLTSFGFNLGDTYVLRDAQDYFNTITTGTYNGTSINLPLNRTNICAMRGTVTHFDNEHTNIDNPGLFNAFIVDRVVSPFGDLTFNRGTPKLRGLKLKL